MTLMGEFKIYVALLSFFYRWGSNGRIYHV